MVLFRKHLQNRYACHIMFYQIIEVLIAHEDRGDGLCVLILATAVVQILGLHR